MAEKKYRVTAGDGTVAIITQPEGMTDEQFQSAGYVKQFTDAHPYTQKQANQQDRKSSLISGARDAVKGLAGLRDAVPGAGLWDAVDAARGKRSMGDITADTLEKRIPGENYEPKTKEGKGLKAVATFAPNAAMGPRGALKTAAEGGLAGLGGLLLGRTAQVVGPAAGSEAGAYGAKKLGGNEEAGRLAGALIGGGVGSLGGARQEAKILAGASKGATPQQLAQATALGEKAQGVGVPLTMAEGVQAKAPATKMNHLARNIEGSAEGAPIRQRMAERPPKVRAAGAKALDAITPAKDPVRVSLDAQDEATAALNKLELARSQAVNPEYAAAGPKEVDTAQLAELVKDIRTQAAGDKTGLISPSLNALADRLAPGGVPTADVENLDRIRKYYRDTMSLPPGSQGALNREESGAVNTYLQRLSSEDGTGLLDQIPEFAAGKAKYADISNQTVDPAMAGPLGDISGKNPLAARDVPALTRQTGALFPDAPPEGQAAVTGQALDQLPNSGPDLVRQFLAKQLAEGTQDLQGGANEWGGAGFASKIAGNPEQSATLAAALDRVGGKDEVTGLLDVLGATGTRLHPGSPTFEKMATDADMKKGGYAGRMFALGAAPHRWGEAAFEAAGLNVAERRRAALAKKLMSEPDQWSGILTNAQDEVAGNSFAQKQMRQLLMNSLLTQGDQ